MSSSKKLTKAKKIETKFPVETLVDALNELGEGSSFREVAASFKIPRSTLWLKYNGKTPLSARKGPSSILSKEEETNIVDWLMYSAKRGFPVSKSQLLDYIQKFLTETKRKTPFTNNRPGRHWYGAFMNRHPELSSRIAQNLTITRASVSEDALRQWFDRVAENHRSNNLLNIEPDRVFNCDESAFMTNPKGDRVIVQKGAASVYQIVSGNEKECVTVLFMFSAAGVMAPPMIVFEGKNSVRKNILEKVPQGWAVGVTENGWMTAESFFEYISNVFYKWLIAQKIQFPVILYIDGHVSHITLPLCHFCQEHQIELTALYPNATHIIQPLDVSLFRVLKDSYKKEIKLWKIENGVVNFKRADLGTVLKRAIEGIDYARIVKQGFAATGLHPFNKNSPNYNVLNRTKKRKRSSRNSPEVNQAVSQDSSEQEVAEEDQKQLLRLFETKLLSPAILEQFKASEGSEWSGDISLKAMFEGWIKLKTGNKYLLIYIEVKLEYFFHFFLLLAQVCKSWIV